MTPTTFVNEVYVLPTGATADTEDEWEDVRNWALKVQWRGPLRENGQGGYAVQGRAETFLSRAGSWYSHPEPFRRHQYRWATMGEAMDAALAAVDSYKMMGRTYEQWVEYKQLRAKTDPGWS